MAASTRIQRSRGKPCRVMRALVTVAARLMNPRRKTRVRANLLRRAKPLHFAKFRHDQQRRVKADAVNVADRLRLRKVRPTLFQLFVESRDLMVVMPQSRKATLVGSCCRPAQNPGCGTTPSPRGPKGVL